MKKKIILILIILLTLCGCGGSYEDTNGDDNYDLQTLKLEDVFEGYSSSCVSSSETNMFKNGEKITYKKFNGILNVYEFPLYSFGDSSHYLKVSFHINKGNAALVIRDDSKIIHIFEINKDDQVIYVEVDEEMVYLTAYGESAEIVVDYEIYD